MSKLFNKKHEIEANAMALTGVCGVAIGLNNQSKEVIHILLHIPLSEFNPPDFLNDPDIELLYVGDIRHK